MPETLAARSRPSQLAYLDSPLYLTGSQTSQMTDLVPLGLSYLRDNNPFELREDLGIYPVLGIYGSVRSWPPFVGAISVSSILN